MSTCEKGGHHGGDHEEDDVKEECSRVVVRLVRIIAQAEVHHSDEKTHCYVTGYPYVHQHLNSYRNAEHSSINIEQLVQINNFSIGLKCEVFIIRFLTGCRL